MLRGGFFGESRKLKPFTEKLVKTVKSLLSNALKLNHMHPNNSLTTFPPRCLLFLSFHGATIPWVLQYRLVTKAFCLEKYVKIKEKLEGRASWEKVKRNKQLTTRSNLRIINKRKTYPKIHSVSTKIYKNWRGIKKGISISWHLKT